MQTLNLNKSLVALTRSIERYNYAKKQTDQIRSDCTDTAKALQRVVQHQLNLGLIKQAGDVFKISYSELQRDFNVNSNGKTIRNHLIKLNQAGLIEIFGYSQETLPYMMLEPISLKLDLNV